MKNTERLIDRINKTNKLEFSDDNQTKGIIYRKLRSLILFLEAHPENEDNSEMRDRLDDVKEMPLLMQEYATQAIKADRERVAENAVIKVTGAKGVLLSSKQLAWIDEQGYHYEINKESILNLPIELP